MAILRIWRGVPGSGKTTAAHRMFPGTVLFENDQYLTHDGKYQWSPEAVKEAIAWCTNMVRTTLEHNVDACVANTFTKKRYIAAYEKIAQECGAKFEVYRCVGNFQNTHGLNQNMVQKFKDAMEDWPGEIIVDSKAV